MEDDGKLHLLASQALHRNRERQSGGRAQGAEGEPIVRLVERIIEIGIEAQASDIHLEPVQAGFRLRYRVDGALLQWQEVFPAAIYDVVAGRIKILANMDTSERRRPADGHISYRFRGRRTDVRVASVPVRHGEAIVLRLMQGEEHLRTIAELGFSEGNERAFRRLIHRPSGMLVVSGPINSGKSSSLYAALQELNVESRSIMTIEDPVECVLDGISQVEVNPKAGLDFSAGLRAALRLDCNCLMVGEIRDTETAQIATRAALTGHVLLTTVHAQDSVATLFRLLEMGVPAYLLAATLSGIVAQRLVRRICPHCREQAETPGGEPSYRGKGCGRCHQTGYLGRTALHEILEMGEPLRRALLEHGDSEGVRRLAEAQGMRTLWQDGLEKAHQGITSREEVERVLYGEA